MITKNSSRPTSSGSNPKKISVILKPSTQPKLNNFFNQTKV